LKTNFCYAIETQNDGAIIELSPCSGHAFSRITYNGQSYLLQAPGLDPDVDSGRGHRVLEGLENIHALKGNLLTSQTQPAYLLKTHIEIKGRSSELALFLAAHQQDYIPGEIHEYAKLCFSASIDKNDHGWYISNCYQQTTLSKDHILKSLMSKYKACTEHQCSALFLLKPHAELLAQNVKRRCYSIENFSKALTDSTKPAIIALSGQDLPSLFNTILDKPYFKSKQSQIVNKKQSLSKSALILCILICSLFIYSDSAFDLFHSAKQKQTMNLSGEWFLKHKIIKTTHEKFLGLELGYRVFIQHKNHKHISIVGEKWTENGRDIPTAAQTPIQCEGSLEGNTITLHFTEEGTRRKSSGQASWLIVNQNLIEGTFISTAANASGNSRLQRTHFIND